MSNFNWPINPTTLAGGAVQFNLDGATTAVSQDTITPANSTPLPVLSLNPSGVAIDPATETTLAAMSAKLPASLGSKTSANSLSVTMASDQGSIPVNVGTKLSTLNSTTALLPISGSWTGTGEDVSNYGVISVAVRSDVASATMGLEFQASPDNTNWYTSDSYTILANTLKDYSLAPPCRYFRVKYTNDGVSQANFFVETIYRQTYVKPSSHRIGDAITANDDAELSTSQIVGLSSSGGGTYVSVKVNPSGALTTDATVTSSVLPTGAATEATLSTLNGKVTACNTGAVTVSSSALPTGAATETTLSSLNGKVTACNTGAVTVSSSALPTGAATETTLSSLNGKVTACNTGAVTVSSSALPTGAATETTLSSLNGKVTACNTGAVTISTALPAGTNTIGYTKNAGLTKSNTPVYNDYGSVNVTTSAYVQLIASTTSEADWIQIFDSSGQAMIIATGGAGAEVDQIYVPPGGAEYNLYIAAGTRVSIKAKTATASSGYLLVNLLG